VELIQQADLVWHKAELIRGEGKVRQRNLCYDEENGAASTKLHFDSAWHRPGGFHEADTEWYVLSGEVRIGDRVLTGGCYFRAPAGLRIPDISVKEGTEVLLFREYGDWGFSIADRNRSGFIAQGGNTASKSAGDNNKGFVTLMCWAPPGWSDDRMIHHPVFEEAYTIDGYMEYNFGRLDPGTYFFRPARVKHGHFMAGEEKGTTWVFRLDGQLINWVTINERIIAEGDALNYDPETEGPVIAGIPVRSRSVGEWDLDGQ
jgi:hypothetical protein